MTFGALCYLLAMVGGVLDAHEVGVWPPIQVSVLAANVSVPSVAWSALASEHGLGVDAQVDAVCVFMAVVAAVLARVAGFANLKKKKKTLHSENSTHTPRQLAKNKSMKEKEKKTCLFFGCGLFKPSSERLRSRETCRAGQAVVARLCVLAPVDSIVSVAGVGDLAALVDVLAGDTVTSVAQRTSAALERAVGEARALCSGETRV